MHANDVICYIHLVFLKYFWNIVGISFFYHWFLHQFTCTYSYYPTHSDLLKTNKKNLTKIRQKRLRKILLGTEKAFSLLASALVTYNSHHACLKYTTTTLSVLPVKYDISFVHSVLRLHIRKVRLISIRQIKCNDPGEIWN